MFDEIEPVACAVFLIALFAIIPFTPLSPFSGRDHSALDEVAGVNLQTKEARVINQRSAAGRMKQVETNIQFTPVIR